jgi:hypothetical protein
MRRTLLAAIVGVLVLGVAIQAIPYGRAHTNPPVFGEPAWDSPVTRTLASRACFDCHSNETVWPWYSNLAPMSWLVQRDVEAGRQAVNFSEWNRPQREAHEAPEVIREGEMPPLVYRARMSARLSAAERDVLAGGLEATVGTRGRRGPGGGSGAQSPALMSR